jgi:hypothetical protein
MVNPLNAHGWLASLLDSAGVSQASAAAVVILILPTGAAQPASPHQAPADDGAEAFAVAWSTGALGLPYVAAKSEDLHQAYNAWARARRVRKVAAASRLVPAVIATIGAVRTRRRHTSSPGRRLQATLILPAGWEPQATADELGQAVRAFATALRTWSPGADPTLPVRVGA